MGNVIVQGTIDLWAGEDRQYLWRMGTGSTLQMATITSEHGVDSGYVALSSLLAISETMQDARC